MKLDGGGSAKNQSPHGIFTTGYPEPRWQLATAMSMFCRLAQMDNELANESKQTYLEVNIIGFINTYGCRHICFVLSWVILPPRTPS
ncbi:MAG: hypothetical protein ACR2QF_01190, partial [Geminicoccaceae bacterium]